MRYPYPDDLPERPADLGGLLFPSVYPNWDNTPRIGAGAAWWPRARPRSGSAAMCAGPWSWPGANPPGEQVVVIKSWNEWAEGNYLEPDTEFGLGRLEALQAELIRGCGPPSR